MGSVRMNIEIDLRDFYYELNKFEKKEMLELLKQDEDLQQEGFDIWGKRANDVEFIEAIEKLSKYRSALTQEDEATIYKLAGRFI